MWSHLLGYCYQQYRSQPTAAAQEKSVPDPETDQICVAVYGFQVVGTEDVHTGIIGIQSVQLDPRRIREFRLDIVDTELDLLNRISDLVAELNPDILTGWEVQRASWGYLNLRAKHYGTKQDGAAHPQIHAIFFRVRFTRFFVQSPSAAAGRN